MLDTTLISDMSGTERPWERLTRLGAEALKDVELLAIVLRTGYQGVGVLDVAAALLAQHPLTELMHLPLARLSRLKGMGFSRAAALIASGELLRRGQKNTRTDALLIRSTNDIVAQSVELKDKKKEHLLALFLNARQQLINREVISIGTLTASLAHPREIFAPAIGRAAASVILVHNHPSGDPEPSSEDKNLTKRIALAGHIMGIELWDHLIIAQEGCYSFREAGHLK